MGLQQISLYTVTSMHHLSPNMKKSQEFFVNHYGQVPHLVDLYEEIFFTQIETVNIFYRDGNEM